MFLTDNIASQAGTFARAANRRRCGCASDRSRGHRGWTWHRGGFALGASGVQIGTAYLFCPEAKVSELHRNALSRRRDDDTVLTNVFTGRPARGVINRIVREVGPCRQISAFPLAAGALAPIRAAAEAKGSADFTSLWSGQSASLGREMPAADLTRTLAQEALHRLKALVGN